MKYKLKSNIITLFATMRSTIILIFLLSSVDMWTNLYQQYKDGTFKKTLFLPETFLGNNFDRAETCKKIEDGGDFRRELKKRQIICRGDWCDIYGEYNCPKGNKGCYNAMHIIPENVEGANILGNRIMVYDRWVKAKPSLAEKNNALGNIYDMAQRNVQECLHPGSTGVGTGGGNGGGTSNDDYSDSYEEEDTSDDLFSLIIYIFIGICIGIFVVIKLNSKKAENINTEDIEMGNDNTHMPENNSETEDVTISSLENETINSEPPIDKI
jgi:hypothetical protein